MSQGNSLNGDQNRILSGILGSNDHTNTVAERQLSAVFDGNFSDEFYHRTVPESCQNDAHLYAQRMLKTLEVCSSRNIQDKGIEKLLGILNCFGLQQKTDTTLDITRLKVGILTGNFELIIGLIEDKIKSIDSLDSQKISNMPTLGDIALICYVVTELFSICALNPSKKPNIKAALGEIIELCKFKLFAVQNNISDSSKTLSQDIDVLRNYILSTLSYCSIIHFSGFSTDPSQNKEDVKKMYDKEREYLDSVKSYFNAIPTNNLTETTSGDKVNEIKDPGEELDKLISISSDKFKRNFIFLDSYLRLLYIQYKKRSYYQIDETPSKESKNLQEVLLEEHFAIHVLFHSYTQVAGYDQSDPAFLKIDEKIDLLHAQGGAKTHNTDFEFDKLNVTMLVVDQIFEDFLENLKSDHYAIGELFLVINAIIQFVDFENEEKILEFHNNIENILIEKNTLNTGYQYPQGSFNLGHLGWKTAGYYKRVSSMMQKLSMTCSMTGVYNKFSFDLQLQNILLQVIRESVNQGSESNKWLISLDIDHFKDINDTYGHDVGDKVLKTFTKVISGAKRQTDWFFRTGGEEFMILCECDTQEGAKAFGLKLLSAVENEVIECIPDVNKDGEITPEKPVTMSVGMVQIKNDGGYTQENLAEFSDHVLKTVDCHLYNVKESGRNGLGIGGEYYSREELSKHLGELSIGESHLELIQKI